MVGLLGLGSGLVADVPNAAAIAVSPLVGWLMLAFAAVVAAMFIAQSERWRRFWLQLEDPRSMGLFRIVFGFFVLCNVNSLWEHFIFLFTDEGIFTADVARQVFAADQFRGYGDGWLPDEPCGFFDLHAWWQFLKGPKYSVLYFWDSPTAFWIHFAAFQVAAICLIVGFRTRLAALLTFVLMNSLFVRNHLFWEGTELVYRVFLAYLVLARAGHAWSVDNWLRCRKLRKLGRLSEPDSPSKGAGAPSSEEHPRGLEAIYRLIPAWPRRLMMLQLATIYTYTGVVKNGPVWARGDAFYYALNMDHFYRLYPQMLSSWFGTNAFRLMTWVTHWWEALFFLLILGVVARWAIYSELPPLRGLRLWVVRACWLALASLALAVTYVTWPMHFTPFPRTWLVPIWVGACALIAAGWWKFGHRPFRVQKLFGHRLRRTYVLDREWFCRWFLGRRVWLTLAVVFQLHVFIMMNVGHFQTGMLSACIIFLSGREVALLMRAVGRKLAVVLRLRRPADKLSSAPVPAEDPTLPHLRRDAAMLPTWTLVVALIATVAIVTSRVVSETPEVLRGLWAVGGFLAVAALVVWRRRGDQRLSTLDPETGRLRMPWAYGPFGRFVVGGLIVWHLVAVSVWLLPEKDCLSAFRGPSRQVFATWLETTQTTQSWGMFAPNPPRQNVFLRVLVTDAQGQVWDLKTDVYAPERKPIPWFWNDRIRKMNRRIIGGESGPTQWYRKWFARYHCRQWALEHGGETPVKVELKKVWYTIPSPESVRDNGWYVPEELLERSGHERVAHTEHCARSIMGQLPDWIRERHGLPPLPETTPFRPWLKHKQQAWERYRARRQKQQ